MLIAADAKLGFDDNAAFRQKELFAKRDSSQEDPRCAWLVSGPRSDSPKWRVKQPRSRRRKSPHALPHPAASSDVLRTPAPLVRPCVCVCFALPNRRLPQWRPQWRPPVLELLGNGRLQLETAVHEREHKRMM